MVEHVITIRSRGDVLLKWKLAKSENVWIAVAKNCVHVTILVDRIVTTSILQSLNDLVDRVLALGWSPVREDDKSQIVRFWRDCRRWRSSYRRRLLFQR